MKPRRIGDLFWGWWAVIGAAVILPAAVLAGDWTSDSLIRKAFGVIGGLVLLAVGLHRLRRGYKAEK